jgi:hypothetical protein
MFTVAGHSRHDEIITKLSLSSEWSGAGMVIMPKLRQETHESIK